MSYNYETVKSRIFTDDGQRDFLKVRDHVHKLLEQSGACSMAKAIDAGDNDSWFLMACVDRMVELGDIREVEQKLEPIDQYRIFTAAYRGG